jgi:hypothetical protein
MQCTRNGRGEACVYASGVQSSENQAGSDTGEVERKKQRFDRADVPPMKGNGRALAPNYENALTSASNGQSNLGKSDPKDRYLGRRLGRIYAKGERLRYLGLGDRMAMLDHVSSYMIYALRGTFEERACR